MMSGQEIIERWATASKLPLGKRAFSTVVGRAAPYTGTISPLIEDLRPGYARIQMADRSAVRNHLKSIHAIALMNLGEVTTGLAMYTGLPKGGRGIIVNLSMAYKKKARGTLVAESTCALPETAGKHDVRITADLKDEAGDVVATATATWRVELK